MYKLKQIKRKSGWGGQGRELTGGLGDFFEEKDKNVQLNNKSWLAILCTEKLF